MARTLADPPDMDLVSGRSASARREGWLMRLVAVAVALMLAAAFFWFIFAWGSALYTALEPYRPACIFPAAPDDGCFASQAPTYP